MRRDGRAEFIRSGGDNDGSGGGGSGEGDVVWVYWRTPEEWAALLEAWVDETAQKGTVLTLYELSQGEDTTGTGTSTHSLTHSLTLLSAHPSIHPSINPLVYFIRNLFSMGRKRSRTKERIRE